MYICKRIVPVLVLLLFGTAVFSQKTTVTYEELYDAPYDINKLFVGFQPIYGETFVTNVNLGFGLEATYFMNNKLDFRAHFRMPYYQGTDFERNVARQNENNLIVNAPFNFMYVEAGATYHIIDIEKDSKSKLPLYSKNYKGSKWASRVPQKMEVPNTKREVVGIRLGGIFFKSATDLVRATEKQNITLVDTEGGSFPANTHIYGNVTSPSIYIGGSLSWIKNFAAKPDKTFAVVTDDHIFTSFVDLLISPFVTVEDIRYGPVGNVQVFKGDQIKTSFLGFRMGVDGKFNREFSWAYGAEWGYRPTVQGRGFYSMIKVSFPVYSTNLDYSVEAFGR
ncbi:hypothetical protein QWY31_05690 [Cytophagales bacterium LB-30]|uniref:Uncharacterized protein n=1 Tax=Shiella aurantiaca TaxID=3058365 RepID=A0ABT8F3Y4_9BACT|nr:hypothetical protein [Shiella aurantiaca]